MINLNNIIANFIPIKDNLIITELNIGLINTSYIVQYENQKQYILQSLNQNVFSNISDLMENAIMIQKNIQAYRQTQIIDHPFITIEFIPAISDGSYFITFNGNFWRMMKYIDHKPVSNGDTSVQLIGEAARILGRFHLMSEKLVTEKLHTILPNFHQIDFYWDHLMNTVESPRRQETNKIFMQIKSYSYLLIKYLQVKKKLPIRVVHNDPKLSNILFNESQQAISIIDWDTIQPGTICSDYGDAIRSFCNTSIEEELDLNKVDFDIKTFQVYTAAYLQEVHDFISPIEKDNLSLFALLTTLEQAIRFYTDYLDNDTYYKVAYQTQNLDRTRVQLKLLSKMSDYLS